MGQLILQALISFVASGGGAAIAAAYVTHRYKTTDAMQSRLAKRVWQAYLPAKEMLDRAIADQARHDEELKKLRELRNNKAELFDIETRAAIDATLETGATIVVLASAADSIESRMRELDSRLPEEYRVGS